MQGFVVVLCIGQHWNTYALHSIKGEASVSLFDVYFVVVFLTFDRHSKEQQQRATSF